MASLSISLFGSFEVYRDGKPIDMLRLEKEQALLAYLAVEGQNAQRREWLATLLWPEATGAHGRANLRQLLHRLRFALGDLDEEPSLLQLSPQYVQLAPGETITVDVNTFAILLNACRTHKHASLASCQDCLANMRAAIALYQGEFLEEWRLPNSALYQDWVTLKQAELHNMAVATLSFLARWHEQHGEYERADDYIQHQLRLEPWSEDAHRERMHILAAEGKRTSALKQFAFCRHVLADELGVEPSWETRHLCQQIEEESLLTPVARKEATQKHFVSLYKAADGAIMRAGHLLAAKHVELLMGLAQRYERTDMLYLAKGLTGVNEFFRGDLQQARWHLEQVVGTDASEQSRNLRAITGIDFYATCLNWLSWTLYILGQYRQAQARASLAISQAEDHRPSKVLLKVLTQISEYCLDTRPAGAGNELQWEEFAQGRDNEVSTQPWREFLDVFTGVSQECTFSANPKAAAAVTSRQGIARLLHDLVYSELCVREDAVPSLLVRISQALALVDKTGTSVLAAEFHRLRGLALLRLAAQQPVASSLRLSLEREAETSLYTAIDLAHTQHLPLWELRATTALCRYYQQSGRREALPLLASVCERYPLHDPSPDVVNALHLLHSLGAPAASIA